MRHISFLFAKKDKKNQLSLETKDSQPSSKIFKLEHHSNFAPVSSCHIFHNHPEQTDPILFSELAEAKIHVLTFITWVRYKIGTYNGRGLLVLVSKLTSPRVQKSWGSKLRDLREYLLLRFLARRDSKWLC